MIPDKDDITVDYLDDGTIEEDHADIEDVMPAASIQSSADARRQLEEYWEQKELDAQLKALDDWDDVETG